MSFPNFKLLLSLEILAERWCQLGTLPFVHTYFAIVSYF